MSAEEQVVDQPEVEEVETEAPAEVEPEEEVVVAFEGEEPEPEEEETKASAPEWVRELRKKHREAQNTIKELQAKVETYEKPATTGPGEKPTLESCDYDESDFERKLTAWHEAKRQADAEAERIQNEQEEQQRAWQTRVEQYNEGKEQLGVADYEDAELAVQELFDVTQQGIIISGADNAAAMIYAIGNNQAKAKELAAIKDPVKFAFAIAKLETKLNVSRRSKAAPPPPEKTVVGTGKASSTDSTLERLRDEAARTGDFSKVHAYKRQKRAGS